jgi:arsenite methyltransferase
MVLENQCCQSEKLEIQTAMGDTFRPGGLELTRRALDFCGLPVGARVLDVGCGAGTTVRFLLACGWKAAGVDLSAELIHTGRGSAPAFIQADAAYLPLAAGAADAILAECSLSVFADPERVLAEFNRLLIPGGRLILSDLYARSPAGLAALRDLSPAGCLGGMLPQADGLARLARNGFDVQVWEDHSEVLRRLTGQLASGVLAQWRGSARGGLDALDQQLAVARARPGYFMLVARKR